MRARVGVGKRYAGVRDAARYWRDRGLVRVEAVSGAGGGGDRRPFDNAGVGSAAKRSEEVAQDAAAVDVLGGRTR